MTGHIFTVTVVQTLFHDDVVGKARPTDPEHFSNRYKSVVATNPTAFHRRKGEMQACAADSRLVEMR